MKISDFASIVEKYPKNLLVGHPNDLILQKLYDMMIWKLVKWYWKSNNFWILYDLLIIVKMLKSPKKEKSPLKTPKSPKYEKSPEVDKIFAIRDNFHKNI